MIKINLLTERKQAPSGPKLPSVDLGANAENMLYGGILVLALAFCGYQWWALTSELKQVRRDVQQANEEVEKVREGLRIIAELEAKKALIDKQVDIISQLRRARTIPVDLMNQVNQNLPDFLWFASLTETGNEIAFNGRATTENAPANLYNNLADSPYFAGVTLNQITKDPQGVTFSLSCTFVPGGRSMPAEQG
jgi:type IV pilus assembly protein PilN